MEHRHHIAVHIGAQRILGIGRSNVLEGLQIRGILEQKIPLVHRPGHKHLMDHGHVYVARFLSSFLVGRQFLKNQPRTSVTRAGVDGAQIDVGVYIFLVFGGEKILGQSQHVHVTGGHVDQIYLFFGRYLDNLFDFFDDFLLDHYGLDDRRRRSWHDTRRCQQAQNDSSRQE